MSRAANVVLASALIASCAYGSKNEGSCDRFLRELASTTPESRATSNFASGRPVLLGVSGFTVDFPGVSDSKIIATYEHMVLQGTSDVIEDRSCKIYQERAWKYAERYNKKLLELGRKALP